MHPSFAPHRNLLAYTSNENGTYEVYVSPFPPTGVKWQVSTGGGRYPTWRDDGRELFFVRADGNLVAVDVRADDSGVVFGPPQKLFQIGIFALAGGRPRYSPGHDGQKFLVTITPDVTIPINVIVNWTALESQPR